MEPATRVFCKLRILLLIDGTLDRFGAWVTNLSETGLFVETPARAPIGTGVRFSLYLSDDQPPLPGHASVVWINDPSGEGPEGMGLQFSSLTAGSQERLMRFLTTQFDPQAVQETAGTTNAAFRQQVEAEAVSALIAELSEPVIEDPPIDTPMSDPDPVKDAQEQSQDDEPIPAVEEPAITGPDDVKESLEPSVEAADEAEDDTPALPPWPYRSQSLDHPLKDLIIIQSGLSGTRIASVEVTDSSELKVHHATDIKDIFINAYWRSHGLEGRALALNDILPDALLPAEPDDVEELHEWQNKADEWATLIYESCPNPSGILLLNGSPTFAKMFATLHTAFSSADLPVPVSILSSTGLAEALNCLNQEAAPILVVEECGEDVWVSRIAENGHVDAWSIPSASQRNERDTLREAILYHGRLPRTLIAPEAMATLIPEDVPIHPVPYAHHHHQELVQIGALRLALGAASE